jgi:heme exporter protein A
VDLRVEAGEAVCIVGPNGSGKSTLLRVLSTAARPTSGEVRVLGFSTGAADTDPIRRRVGFLPDRPYLYGELTALENLRFAAVMYGLDRSEQALREAIAAAGLGHVGDARVRTFSRGMAQRLSLARTMLHDPDLVLLDEPYNALDAEGSQLVDRFLGDLRRTRKTALIVTHHVERGLALCDRAVALRAGRLVFDGPPESFIASSAAGDRREWTSCAGASGSGSGPSPGRTCSPSGAPRRRSTPRRSSPR